MTKHLGKKPEEPASPDRQAELDEAIAESFPASDPSSASPTSAGGPVRAPVDQTKKKAKPRRR